MQTNLGAKVIPVDIQVFVDTAANAAKLVVKRNDKIVCDVMLDGSELAEGLFAMIAARAALRDQVPMDLEPKVVIPDVINPRWYVPDHTLEGNRQLIFRHPGIGWTAYLLPQHEANSIAEWLTKNLKGGDQKIRRPPPLPKKGQLK